MVVDCVRVKAEENYLPVDGDPEQAELSQDRDQQKRKDEKVSMTSRNREKEGFTAVVDRVMTKK